jgi:hypothetical protein
VRGDLAVARQVQDLLLGCSDEIGRASDVHRWLMYERIYLSSLAGLVLLLSRCDKHRFAK